MGVIKIRPYCFIELYVDGEMDLQDAIKAAEEWVKENGVDMAELEHEGQIYVINPKIHKPHICACCGSDRTYITKAIHCNRCAENTEI